MRDSMYLTSSEFVQKQTRVATPTFGDGCSWKGRELHKSKQKNNINEQYEKSISPIKDNEGIGGYNVISDVSGLVSQPIPKFGTQRKHQTEIDLDISELRENATQSLKQSSIYQNQHLKPQKQHYYQLQCDSSSFQALSLNHLDLLEQSGSTSATLKHPKISKKSPLFEKFGQKKHSSAELSQFILRQRSPNDSQNASQAPASAYNYSFQTGQKFSKLESSSSFHESSSKQQFRDNNTNNTANQRYFPFSIDSSLDVTPEKGKSPNISHIRAFSQQKSDSLPCPPESARFTFENSQNMHIHGLQSFRTSQNTAMNPNQVQLHAINVPNNIPQVFLPSLDIPSSQSMSPTKLIPSPQRILLSNQASGELIPLNCDEKYYFSQDATAKELNCMDKIDYSAIANTIIPTQIKHIIPSSSKKANSKNITLISNESPNGISQNRRVDQPDRLGQMKHTNQLLMSLGERQAIQLNLCSGERLESVLVKKKPPKHTHLEKSRESTRTSRGVSSVLTPPDSAVTTTSNPSKKTQRTLSNNGSPLERNEPPLLEMARFCSEEIEIKKPNSQQNTPSNPLSHNTMQQCQNQKPPNFDGQLLPQKGIITLRKTLYGNVSASEKSKRSSSTKNQTKLHFFPHPPLSTKEATKTDNLLKQTGKTTNLSSNTSPTNCQLEPIKLSIHPYSADNSDFDNPYKPQVTVRSSNNRPNITDNICNRIRGMFMKQKEIYESSRNGSTSAREQEQEERELMKELSTTLEDLKQVNLNASVQKKRSSFSLQNKISLN